MNETSFPDPAPGTTTVTFRMPIEGTPEELKAWFGTKIKKKWRIAIGGQGTSMDVWPTRSRREWRLRIKAWERIVNMAKPWTNGTYYTILVNFDDPKDAMLFKLTWG
jgi:hypothetical protein